MLETQIQSLGWEDSLWEGIPLQYSCQESPYGKRGLVGYSPWGRKESDTTEVTGWVCTQEQWSGGVKVVVLVQSRQRDACSLNWEQGVLVSVFPNMVLEWMHLMFIFCETVTICLGISWQSFTVLSRHYSPLSRAPWQSIHIWRKHRNICWVSCEHNFTVWT